MRSSQLRSRRYSKPETSPNPENPRWLEKVDSEEDDDDDDDDEECDHKVVRVRVWGVGRGIRNPALTIPLPE